MPKRYIPVEEEGIEYDQETEYDPEPWDEPEEIGHGDVRTFASGATRDTEEGKPDFGGFESWEVMTRFAEYMHKHRIQKDGSLRAADNWKKSIPRSAYFSSAFRHFMDFWMAHDDLTLNGEENWDLEAEQMLQDSLCALRFNIQGYLFERLNGR